MAEQAGGYRAPNGRSKEEKGVKSITIIVQLPSVMDRKIKIDDALSGCDGATAKADCSAGFR